MPHLILILLLCLAGSTLGQAAQANLTTVDTIGNLPGGGTQSADQVEAEVIDIIEVFLGVLAVIAVIVIIIAGTRLLLSGGNEEAARGARRQILYAVIGLIVILLSVLIVNLVIGIIK